MKTRSRTPVEADVWTVLGLVSVTLVGLAWTRSVALSGAIALITCTIGHIMHLIHEHIQWGRTHG